MINIKVSHDIQIPRSDLTKNLERVLIRMTTHKDPLYARNKKRGWEGDMSPIILTHTVEDDTLHMWRGCMSDLKGTLNGLGVPFQVDDQRLWLDPVDFGSTIVLRDYQVPLFEAMVKRQQTIIRSPAGSGKTETCLAVVAHFQQPTLVLVWQQRQQKNLLERIPKYFTTDVGGVGGAFKKPVYAPIMVGMVQSVRNRIDELAPLFGCVVCDEVQRFAASTLSQVVNSMPAAIRLGASDDERRKDDREFLLYDTFGPTGASLAQGTGQCPVEVIAVPSNFKAAGNNWNSLIDAMTTDKERNDLIVSLAAEQVAAGHRVLIWSDRVDHCQFLCECFDILGIPAGLLIGGTEFKEEADWTEAGLNDGTVKVGIGTSVAEQSINIPPLDRGIMTCASADAPKFLRFKQMRGRLTRPHPGKDSKLFYIWDRRVPVLKRKADLIRMKFGLTMQTDKR